MSLDIMLLGPPPKCPNCGYILENQTQTEYFSQNITHNLATMAREAGIYECLWHPEETGFTQAKQLIEPLSTALQAMVSDPPRFKKFDSPNGWGLYQNFVPWLIKLLEACREYPEAYIKVSR